MQLRLPWSVTSAPRARPREVIAGGQVFPVVVCRHPRSRRYLVRVTPDGRVRLTVPRGASISAGIMFAERQAGWIASQWERHVALARPWRSGTVILYRGERVRIDVHADRVTFGLETAMIRAGDVRGSVEAHLRAIAERELPARCGEFAAACGVTAPPAAVRNQRTRWGACSPRLITLNWRLVQMPPPVSDYVILHELMHLRQPNHSRRFWREVDSVCPGWRDAETWLETTGRELL